MYSRSSGVSLALAVADSNRLGMPSSAWRFHRGAGALGDLLGVNAKLAAELGDCFVALQGFQDYRSGRPVWS